MSQSNDRMAYRRVTDGAQAALMDDTRRRFIALGEFLEDHLPPSRELSLALTDLQGACQWAITAQVMQLPVDSTPELPSRPPVAAGG